MKTKIKICGLKRPEDVEIINEVQPDYCGFVIDFPKSHRSIPHEEVEKLTAMIKGKPISVGVFVNAPAETVVKLLQSRVIRMAQFHGNEDDDYIKKIRYNTKAKLIKAFRIRSAQDLEAAKQSAADYVLLDNGTGTGEAFDWTLITDLGRPYFLAGGLNAENLPEAIHAFHPFAVDISSGVETDRLKDPDRIRRVMQIVRSTDRVGRREACRAVLCTSTLEEFSVSKKRKDKN